MRITLKEAKTGRISIWNYVRSAQTITRENGTIWTKLFLETGQFKNFNGYEELENMQIIKIEA